MKKQTGFVLWLVLTLNAVLALFVLISLQTLALQFKSSHQRLIAHQQFYQLQNAMMTISQKANRVCQVASTQPDELVRLLKQQYGCTLQMAGQTYRYLISDLRNQPCMRIMHHQQLMSSHHWLITVMNTNNKRMLQVRLAEPERLMKCDLPTENIISTGILSWRAL